MHEAKYMKLLMMISLPKQPGNDINIYLKILIKNLRILWEESVDVNGAYTNYNFKLCVMLFYTINDFFAYSNLSGYNVNGHKACPICEDDTCFHQLKKMIKYCLPWTLKISKT